MNKVIISGYMGNDPKIDYTQSGKKKASCSVSVKIGKEWKFLQLTAWDYEADKGNASFAEQHLRKRDYVIIEAHLDSYESTDQTGRKSTRLGLVVDHFEMTGSKPQQVATPQEQRGSVSFNEMKSQAPEIDEADLPF